MNRISGNRKLYEMPKLCENNINKNNEYQNFLISNNIYTFDDFISFLKEKNTTGYKNQVINIYIYVNFSSIKKNNGFLAKIYSDMYKIPNNSKLSNFINNWFKNKKLSDFYFNLGNDILNLS